MCTGAEFFLVAATAANAVGQIVQGNQAKAFGNFQQAQANADAQAEQEAGQVRAAKIRKAGTLQRSEATAALASSGVETGAGTALKIDQYQTRTIEEDALQEMLYGSRKAARLQQEGEAAAMAGKNAQTRGYLGAAASLLSSGATLSKGWKTPARSSASSMQVYDGGTVRIA